MERFAREDVRAVLALYSIRKGRRAIPLDETEEIVLLTAVEFGRTDIDALTKALMDVLPHTKVWVAPDGPNWTSEEI